MRKLDKWHKTRSGLLLFGLVELAAAYGFVCLAIDRGNLVWYALTLIFFVGGLGNFVKLIGKLFHGRRKTR